MKDFVSGIPDTIKTKLLPGAKRVWTQYGYYISLAMLIALFGTAAYLYKNGGGDESMPVIAKATQPASQAVMAIVTPEPTKKPEPAFIMPVIGEVSREYSPDSLAWNETLRQWRTHSGIDIAAPAGTAVMAAEDGAVLDKYEDDIYGLVIEVGHTGGYMTRYSSLGTLGLIDIGEEVKRGQVISSVSATALIEASDGAHLHFEVLREGENVKPVFSE